MGLCRKGEIAAAREKWPLPHLVGKYTKLVRKSRVLVGLCPFHKEKTPSFTVYPTGTYVCYGCGARGDAIDFVMQTENVSFVEACKRMMKDEGHKGPVVILKKGEASGDLDTARRIAHAHELWLKSLPIAGTLAERYLRDVRRIEYPPPLKLGYVHEAYCSALKDIVPAMIAPLQNSAGHVTAVQRIFLEPETADACRDENGKRIKLTIGVMGDAAVRLAPEAVNLGIAGSVEDALAAMQLYNLPVWATCGEMRLDRVWIPPVVENLMVFADGDAQGLKYAQGAVYAHRRRIPAVNIITPSDAKDWAQMIENRSNAA